MILSQILTALEKIAPLSAAETWDNVGLLAGDPQQEIKRIFLTIDYTPPVAAEAREHDCDLVIAYHPPLFSAIKRITANGSTSLLHDAIRRGVAIYSPHTAWDVAEGGTNDLLADCLGLTDRRPLRATKLPADLKLVTFVPETHLESLSRVLFAAGAGHIGNYSSCSFRTAGTGTFLGEAGSKPTIGQPGRLETVSEYRLETIVPVGKVDAVVTALRTAHPYEEPAFDLTVLAGAPNGGGQGRIGELPTPVGINDLADRLKKELDLSHLLIAGDENKSIRRIAMCAGAGGELLDDAISAKADLFVTGELRHHDALKANRAGMAIICTLHSNSERASLKRLKSRLENAGLANLPPVLISQLDRDPFLIR